MSIGQSQRSKSCSPVGAVDVKYSCAQVQLKREDVMIVPQQSKTTSSCGKCVVFAIGDGHGGSQASKFVARHLEQTLYNNLNQDHLEYAMANQGMEHVAQIIRSCLHATFLQLDKDFVDSCQYDAGTTLTVLVICGRLISVASVGDSKAVLVLPELGQKLDLTADHRIHDNDEERLRMLRSGATISKHRIRDKYVGVLRVYPGGLALSRSIGDRVSKPHVIPDPFISQAILPTDQKAKVILASDGLWDELSSKEAQLITQSTKLSSLPAKLIQAAFQANNYQVNDDTSVLAISIKPHKMKSSLPMIRSLKNIIPRRKISKHRATPSEPNIGCSLSKYGQQPEGCNLYQRQCLSRSQSNNVDGCLQSVAVQYALGEIHAAEQFQDFLPGVPLKVYYIDTIQMKGMLFSKILANLVRWSAGSSYVNNSSFYSDKSQNHKSRVAFEITPMKSIR
eukprot:TRINITY_DN1105_c0_g1_i2.p1 TRINITY_DN1105_c0_g1~~TRINITY_DN1105_c0_g1_i2.p1  ORF type:complete len:451 (-),score=13.63 TRINITY_DN1105_c0_g1_i2:2319-3671(-)